jgi:hypothetical protein
MDSYLAALFPDDLRERVSASRALLIGDFGDDYNLVIETPSVLKRAGLVLGQP